MAPVGGRGGWGKGAYILTYIYIYLFDLFGYPICMAKPMMLQDEDAEKIEQLKKQLGSKSKIDVVRRALELLEQEVRRTERIKRWKRAARIVGDSGLEVMNSFQNPKRFDRVDE